MDNHASRRAYGCAGRRIQPNYRTTGHPASRRLPNYRCPCSFTLSASSALFNTTLLVPYTAMGIGHGRVQCRGYGRCTPPSPSVFTACTRPCTHSCTQPVHGHLHGHVHCRVRGPYTATTAMYRPCTPTAMYTACRRSCTRRCTRAVYTAVYTGCTRP